MPGWNPDTYAQFATERSRPFFDLVQRIRADQPRRVIDLGCGPGDLTATLADRWPGAVIEGVDSSSDMIERARRHRRDGVSFALGDLRQWSPPAPVDVLISNATLQWVPGHRTLLPRLLDSVVRGGWLALQVPGNFDEPSHRLLRALAREDRFAAATAHVEEPQAHDAITYLGDLEGLGCQVEAWETTYLHVLAGPDPVFRWISGTGARPIFEALTEPLRSEFVAAYQTQVDRAYPPHDFGTVLPFRRIFVVAQKQ